MPLLAPPMHLSESMHAEWRVIHDDLSARGLLSPSMLSLLTAYLSASWLATECRVALERDGAFIRTKNEQPRAHPAIGILSKNVELVARLGAELGLTPAARQRKGMQSPAGPTGDAAGKWDL